MKLFGETNQEIREENGTLHSWEAALYRLGQEKAYRHRDSRQSYYASNYRENPLNLLGWPTESEIRQTLEDNAAEKQVAETSDPYQDLLTALVPATQKLIRGHIGQQETKRLATEQQIAIFHDYLTQLNATADYYLSLQATGELSYENAKSSQAQVSTQVIEQVLENPMTIPLHQWVKGLILRFAAPQNTFTSTRSEERPPKEPTSAELKNAANWINEPHFGLGSNLPETIETMKRYRIEGQKRGDIAKSYPLHHILEATPPIQTLKGVSIDWQAWGFLPYPNQETKKEVLTFLAETPQAAALIQTEQAECFARRWIRAIALRAVINTQFLQIDINQQEQTERTIIDPAKTDAAAWASGIPELHLLVATEMAWNFNCFYWIQHS
jgi:hypothetical protein